MRERALGSGGRDRASPRLSPGDAGLPRSPSLDSGLEPTETVTRRIDAGPLSALRYQEFADVPLQHAATAAVDDGSPHVVATLANESGESWAYRVSRGPAPFAGGRATADGTDTELRAAPVETADGFTDGVLRPGESVRSTVSVSALTGADPGWPEGAFTFLQPLSVWTADRAFSYNWRITLRC